jgi:threonine/homoserine/homoserine lactone efflux protein
MTSHFLGLLFFAFVAAITPGPNNILVSASGANYGFRRSIPQILGNSVGMAALIAITGLGLGQVFGAYPVLHQVLRWAGTAYLLYLSWRIASAGQARATAGNDRPLTFLQSAALQWVNPKAWSAAVIALALYTSGQTAFMTQALWIAGVFLVLSILSCSVWCAFGSVIGRLLTSPHLLRAFNWTMGGLVAASILLLFL